MRVAKLLSTSVTAAALAFSMLASTIPASAADPGYHAAYFSESSFLSLAPGQSGQFAVGFSNTGDQAWTKGSATAQASLMTRNGDSSLYAAGWGPTWFNSTTYANQANDLVAPGQVGFFIYNLTVPAGAAQGEQRFTGIPWIVGQAMEDYGYYQIVTVTSSAIKITGSSPASPSTTTTPTISGSGATATTTVTVQEGSTSLCTATASSTGTFSCTTSALALGSHALTATAAGQGTSEVFTYVVDTAAPTIASVDTSGGLRRVKICYNKAMSASGVGDFTALASYTISGFNGGFNLSLTATGVAPTSPPYAGGFAIYAASDNKCGTLVLDNNNAGLVANTSYTLTVNNVADAAGNKIAAASTFAFTASDATFPTATGVTQPGAQEIIVSFSEPMVSATLIAANFKWDSAAFPGTVSPKTSGSDQYSKVRLTFGTATAAATGAHTLDVSTVTDVAGNVITPNPTTFTVTIVSDSTRPTVTSATTSRTDAITAATYTQYVTVNYSEAMKATADWGATNAFNNVANYAVSNPDGSAGTTGCASGVGTAITVAGASTSHASTARFENKTVRLSLSALLASGCQYTLTVTNVQDQAGNALNPNPTLVTISDTADTASFSVTGASTTATTLTVCYNKTVYASATAAARANYTSAGTNLGTALAGSGAAGVITNDGMCYGFTYGALTLASGSYQLTITGVSDSAANLVTPNPTTVTVTYGDTTAPTLLSAQYTSSGAASIVRAVYSKAMTGGTSPSNSAGNTVNYSINNGAYGTLCATGTATITATTTTVWDISCTGGVLVPLNPSGGGITQNSLSVKNVADSNGNVISPNPASRAF